MKGILEIREWHTWDSGSTCKKVRNGMQKHSLSQEWYAETLRNGMQKHQEWHAETLRNGMQKHSGIACRSTQESLLWNTLILKWVLLGGLLRACHITNAIIYDKAIEYLYVLYSATLRAGNRSILGNLFCAACYIIIYYSLLYIHFFDIVYQFTNTVLISWISLHIRLWFCRSFYIHDLGLMNKCRCTTLISWIDLHTRLWSRGSGYLIACTYYYYFLTLLIDWVSESMLIDLLFGYTLSDWLARSVLIDWLSGSMLYDWLSSSMLIVWLLRSALSD